MSHSRKAASLEILTTEYTIALANILNTDHALNEALGRSTDHLSPEAFEAGCSEWVLKNQGQSYAVVYDREAVGLLSISNDIHSKGDTARIGYWLASNKWQMGIGTQAFSQALSITRGKGHTRVTATIPKLSIASYRMWEKNGALFTENKNRRSFTATIDL